MSTGGEANRKSEAIFCSLMFPEALYRQFALIKRVVEPEVPFFLS